MHIATTAILSALFLANTGLAVDCMRVSYTTCEDRIVHHYDLDTGEVCDAIDCGGGRAPVKYDVPCCAAYRGTEPCIRTKSTLSCFQAKTPSTSSAAAAPSNTGGAKSATTTTTATRKNSTSTSTSASTGAGSAKPIGTSSSSSQTDAAATTAAQTSGQTTAAPTGAPTTTPATGRAGRLGQAPAFAMAVAAVGAVVVAMA